MAFVRVQTANFGNLGGANTIPATFAGTVGVGNTVLGTASCDSAGNFSSVTDDKGNTYTIVSNVNDATQGQRYCSFALGNITNAPITITVNLSGAVNFRDIVIDEFSGAEAATNNRDGGTGQNQAAPGTGTDAITSGAIVTTQAGDLIWGAGNHEADTALPTAGTGFTNSGSDNVVQGVRTEYLTQGAAGSIAATFTQAVASRTTAFVIAIKAPSSAATTQAPLLTPHFGRGKQPWSRLRTSPLSLVPAASTADLAGSTTLTFSPSGALQGSSALAGVATLTFSPSGNLVGSSALAGATTLTFTPSGSLVGVSALSGQTSLTFTVSASLAGDSALAGQTTLTFTPSGALVGSSALAGATSITFTPSADLTITAAGTAALAGQTSITFTLTADLSVAGGGGGAAANQNYPFIANVGTLMGR